MPFDEEDQEETHSPSRDGLKKVSSQPSLFDKMPKKPTQADLDLKVQQIQERTTGYKLKVSEFAIGFNKAIKDKTLRQNKNIIQRDMEKELIDEMIKFAFQVNEDPAEQEGAGSVSLIMLLLQAIMFQRDRINELEYNQVQAQKKMDAMAKETQGLDKPKDKP
jgi:hypothetical protein